MVKNFKNFFPTVKKNVKVWELIYWWILRGLMIFALIYTIVVGHGPMGEYKGRNPWQQVAANLVGMFAYEIILLFFKEDSFFRNLSPRFQDITALGFFLGSFGGGLDQGLAVLLDFVVVLGGDVTDGFLLSGVEEVCLVLDEVDDALETRAFSHGDCYGNECCL